MCSLRLFCLPLFASVALSNLTACVNPARRADRIAAQAGFTKEIVAGSPFRHVVYRNSIHDRDATLHVYIEGDGTPFVEATVVAADPTPRNPLMLRLMAEDDAPSVYLARPCYFGLAHDSRCDPAEWTLRRFAPEVLDSMASALRAEIARSGAAHVVLFGHSGGGALAVLLAQRVDQVHQVVTIAPTLDIEAWCALHGYVPLRGSLNPAEERPHREDVTIVHWVGDRDSNTPLSMVAAAAQRRGEPMHVVAGFDHVCCWSGMWHQILDTVRPGD